jgi:hypothetical protein
MMPWSLICLAKYCRDGVQGLCQRGELIGAPFKDFFTDPARAVAGIKLVLSEKKVTDYELTACHRDGTRTVLS